MFGPGGLMWPIDPHDNARYRGGMTMTTFVYVLDEMRPKDLFLKCNQLIGATETTEFRNEQVKSWRKGIGKPEPGNAWSISNKIAQGLCAALDVYYRPDTPLRAADNGCEWYCDPGCDDEHTNPACWLEVSFDTAYGWRGKNDEKCGDLHAKLVAQLGQWLDERGIQWSWRNDHHGGVRSDYESLSDLRSAA